MMEAANPTPEVFSVQVQTREPSASDYDDNIRDKFDPLEIYEILRTVKDPEHPVTLEQLKVISVEQIKVDDAASTIEVQFTPTVAHCTMATLIGLCIRVKLLRLLPRRFKVQILLSEGSHSSEEDVNKQLNDKERIAAAMENTNLLNVVNNCLSEKPITDELPALY
ncbi:mitotic spindle-associated mmxd complex subunit mip18 [Pelomyxa schiedti]|nr:mitotic spindle-associated mmxd complex subunit mip18 [Pelomyxa schiedti]